MAKLKVIEKSQFTEHAEYILINRPRCNFKLEKIHIFVKNGNTACYSYTNNAIERRYYLSDQVKSLQK